MKLFSKTAIIALACTSIPAFAAEPIVGVWQTFEDGKPKAQVQISDAGGALSGVVIDGNTDKAKTYIGRTVISGLKADGGGKYSGGTITDPVNGKSYKLTATLSGNNLALKGHLGPFSRTQNWKRIK